MNLWFSGRFCPSVAVHTMFVFPTSSVAARLAVVLVITLSLAGCASRFNSEYASGRYASSPVQCVPHARAVSGINLRGDAYTWWDQANAPAYARVNTPSVGSVLVLSRTDRMTHGHVAAVKRIINSREIDVSHSNWGSNRKNRRIIYDFVRVRDISANNDWTLVKFFNHDTNAFGFPYAAKGFIRKN